MPINENDLPRLREALYGSGAFCMFMVMCPEDAVTPMLADIAKPESMVTPSHREIIAGLLGNLSEEERKLFTEQEKLGADTDGHPANVEIRKAVERLQAAEQMRRLSTFNVERVGPELMCDEELRLHRIEIERLEKSRDEPCNQCKSNTAEFSTAVWYAEDFDSEPDTEELCGVCLAVWFLQESSVEHAAIQKKGDVVGVSNSEE